MQRKFVLNTEKVASDNPAYISVSSKKIFRKLTNMTTFARKYFYAVATLAIFVILGLLHSMDFAAQYRKPFDVISLTRLREDKQSLWNPSKLSRNASFGHRHNNYSATMNTIKMMNKSIGNLEHNISKDARAVVIFNVMPKSGSRTLNELAVKLANSSSRGIVVTNTMGGYWQSHDDKLREIRQFVYGSKVGFLYSHMRFQQFGVRDRQRAPIYISIVRDPIDRLASLYYFVRYGDGIDAKEDIAGKEFRERMSQMNYSSETFNECVLNGGTTCRDPGAMVRHFCGIDKKVCTNSRNKRAAYKRAVKTVDEYYTAIGVMEDYVSTLQVFEKLIPDMFEGVTDMYLGQKRAIVGKMRTKNKTRVAPAVRKILRREMAADYNLYSYIRRKFARLRRALGIGAEN